MNRSSSRGKESNKMAGGIRRGMLLQSVMLIMAAMVLLSACSTKKNTPMSRQWQAFTTRYNVYYNGSEHFKETLKSMEDGYEDDYSRTLLTHPADARADSKYPQPSGDFKRTIEKMQKAIQLHSIKKKPAKKSGSAKEKAFRAREEFNPFLHNAWMTMGKAQYFNGDFLGAASTFFYISKHFKWLPETVTEAQLWQARSYCALDWDNEAENVLRLVKPAQLKTSALTNLYNLVQASFLVRTDKYKEAIPYLKESAAKAKGSQKNRLYFLLGQMYEKTGNKTLAYEAFKKAGSGVSTAYRTKFNARIKRSEVFTGKNIKGEVNSLRSLTRYERNKEFLDQIYYAIGNLYMSRKDTTEALKNYLLAVEKSTRNGIDKAMAQLALGNIYFTRREYVKAQPCYSEAVPQLNNSFPNYDMLKKRSDVLDELATYAGNVELQDSLLQLSALPEEERLKVCERLAAEFIKKEKEEEKERQLQEALANREETASPMDSQSGPTGFQANSDKSWYFYNTMTKNTGKSEFQRRWGARKLEDDWRRRNKSSYSLEEPETEENSESDENQNVAATDSLTTEQAEAQKKEQDPHYAEYYLRQIPATPEQIQTANEVIEEGLYNMGLILKDKLEDFPAARAEFTELNERYPDNTYRLEVYYNLYLMAVREDDTVEAEKWKNKILEDFPESPYGVAMQDPDYFNKLRRMHQLQEAMYQEAYDAYLANDNTEVHRLTKEMETDYPLSAILPKFVFIDALSYLTEGDNEQFRERLQELLQKWPETDMTPMAGSILQGLKDGKVPHQGVSNNRGLLWDTRLTGSGETPAGSDGLPANFERDPSKPQIFVLAFPRDSVSSNQLLYDVARFNFSSFVVKDFDLEQMSFGNVGLIIIRGFENLAALEHYRTVMARSDFRLPEGVRPIMISKANFDLLLREGRSFEEYFRFQEQSEVEATEQKVLGEAAESPEQKEPEEPSEPADPEMQSELAEPTELTEPAELSEPGVPTEDAEGAE